MNVTAITTRKLTMMDGDVDNLYNLSCRLLEMSYSLDSEFTLSSDEFILLNSITSSYDGKEKSDKAAPTAYHPMEKENIC